MAKKRYSAEQIIQLLREVEIHTSEGKTISQASRQIGVTEQTQGRVAQWRNLYQPKGDPNTTEKWRREYNEFRPHSALNYKPPVPSAILPKEQVQIPVRLTY